MCDFHFFSRQSHTYIFLIVAKRQQISTIISKFDNKSSLNKNKWRNIVNNNVISECLSHLPQENNSPFIYEELKAHILSPMFHRHGATELTVL